MSERATIGKKIETPEDIEESKKRAEGILEKYFSVDSENLKRFERKNAIQEFNEMRGNGYQLLNSLGEGGSTSAIELDNWSLKAKEFLKQHGIEVEEKE